MAKKYLTLEEAAADLGISGEELTQRRAHGEIRGFSDRGTWKFKPEDVDQLREKLSEDSEPPEEIEIDWSEETEQADDAIGDFLNQLPSDSVLDGDDDELDFEIDLGEEPTTVRPRGDDAGDEELIAADSNLRLSDDEVIIPNRPDSDPEVQLTVDSDSDVRLAGSADGQPDSDSDVALVDDLADSDSDVAFADSDSDVRLTDDAAPTLASDSESDVALADSDVRLTDEAIPTIDAGSDSDVAIVDSDSDVSVTDSDSDVRLTDEESPLVDLDSDSDSQLVGMDSDSDVRLALPEEGSILDSDSDVALLEDLDETVMFEAAPKAGEADLGISDESGIALSAESGIALGHPVDSGISLEDDEDSGITLDDESGISLDISDESGIALELGDDGDDLTASIPTLDHGDDDVADTVFEVPTLDGEEELDFDIKESDDTEAETSVLLFDDEGSDAEAPTLVKPSDSDEQGADVEETFEFDEAGDDFEDAEDFGDDFGAEDEGDEEDLDVFDAEDADFEEVFDSGESAADFAAPLGGAPRVVAPVEIEWGISVFLPLVVASLFLCVCGVIMFDLVRSMWGWQEISTFNSPLLDVVGGFFK